MSPACFSTSAFFGKSLTISQRKNIEAEINKTSIIFEFKIKMKAENRLTVAPDLGYYKNCDFLMARNKRLFKILTIIIAVLVAISMVAFYTLLLF